MRTSFALSMCALLAAFVCGCWGTTNKLAVDLANNDPKVRRAAAQALGDAPQQATGLVIAALASASKDPDREVRELAVAALGRVGPAAKSSESSLEAALGDEEKSVRICAALALEKVDPGNERYEPVVLEALNAGDGPVFLDVGRMGADAKWAVPTLTKLLSDPRAGIRALAARTLGEIGAASEAESRLKQSLNDSDPAVRTAAKKALEQIHPRQLESAP
jgi:HEAT repeat protein